MNMDRQDRQDRERKRVDMDEAMEVILGERRERPPTPTLPRGRERERGRKATPHEQGRHGRRMTVTLPDAEWAEAIREIAQKFGLRPSDFLVWCISLAMYGIEMEGEKPEGTVDERSGVAEGVRLPWEP